MRDMESVLQEMIEACHIRTSHLRKQVEQEEKTLVELEADLAAVQRMAVVRKKVEDWERRDP